MFKRPQHLLLVLSAPQLLTSVTHCTNPAHELCSVTWEFHISENVLD